MNALGETAEWLATRGALVALGALVVALLAQCGGR